jgi:ABC-type transport system substrate-binding protein
VPCGPRALADARQLLSQAGYPQGLDLQMIFPYCGAPEQAAVAKVLVQEWAQIGIRLTWQSIGCFTSLWDGFPWQSGNFEIFLGGISAGPDPRPLRPWLVPPAIPPEPGGRESNWGRIDDAVLTRDWARAIAAPTAAARNAWYRRIQERVIKQAYWIPLYWQPVITAVSDRVQGFGETGSAPVWLPQQWRLSG